ncbi:MAG TPA: cell envelope integrity protein TolA [Woeseiaceae bacterium]|nr:cell envelope integrity protein TolA [Woeseiaceae bacterium]
MAHKTRYFVPVTLSVLLHAGLLATMFVAFDWARPAPITPMAIHATLVTEDKKVAPPPVVEKKPEPEPVVAEPEPVVEEPEPEPEPDNSEELRRAAEEQKRIQDALIEKERLEKIRQQEEAERKKKEREEAQRKKDEEARKEREREEAERKRQEDIKRQREENERKRRELEARERAQEIEDEERRLAAESSPAMAAYQFAISQKIRRNWAVPASAGADTVCIVNVRQIAGGEIVGVSIVSCNGDEAVRRSVEAAIYRSSPLPTPPNPDLFRPLLELTLAPEH